MSDFAAYLKPYQVFSGKSDPVSVIQTGSPEKINKSVTSDFHESGKRCIVSAGCEITPETSAESMRVFKDSARNLIWNKAVD